MGDALQKLIGSMPRTLRIALIVVAAVAVAWLSLEMDKSMQPAVDDSEFGIVSFEFARTPERATEILDDWRLAGREGARQAIKIDYGFLVAYSVLLAVASGSVAMASARRSWAPAQRAGWALAGLSLVAGLLDAVENAALLNTLDRYDSADISSLATVLASTAAAVKFAIVLAAIIYLVVVLAAIASARMGQDSDSQAT